MTRRLADLLICDFKTGKVVDRIELSSVAESFVDRVVGGILINLDTERYFVDESEVEARRSRIEDLRAVFKVGDGVTVRYVADCYPATVVRVTRTRLDVQADRYQRLDDRGPHTENQEYEYTRDPNGRTWSASLRKNGAVKLSGARSFGIGSSVSVGRRAYRDPSF